MIGPTPRRRHAARRATTAVVLAVLVALVGLGAAGCAIPEDSKPQAVEKVSLPPQLVDPPSTTTPQPASETETRSVYLVKAATSPDGTDSLQPVRTQVRVPTNPDDAPRAVIDQLLRLPTAEQKSLGLRTDIPSTVRVRSVSRDAASGVLTVDLSGLGQVEGPKQRLAAAQIVFTATELPGISAVRFEIDGAPATIPLDDRTSAAGQPITRQDFPKLNQLLGGSTTTSSAAPTTVPAPPA